MIGLLVFTVDKFRLVLKIIDFLLHDVFFVNLLLCNSISSVTKSLFMWCFKMFRSALEVFFLELIHDHELYILPLSLCVIFTILVSLFSPLFWGLFGGFTKNVTKYGWCKIHFCIIYFPDIFWKVAIWASQPTKKPSK